MAVMQNLTISGIHCMKQEKKAHSGILYAVATPIGNLEDMSYRAVRILKTVDMIAAEDTRHTGKLLKHYNINNVLVSCHEHNEAAKVKAFIEKLKKGINIALVSDAGTPCISDPGFRLVKAAADAGICVIPIPGPSAVVAGLSVSGIPTDSFLFSGFASRKKEKRKRELKALKFRKSTLVFYESPKRITGFIEELITIFGDRPAMLAREITKLHEEYLRGNLSELFTELKNRNSVKGECSLFVAGNNESNVKISEKELDKEILSAMEYYDQSTSKMAKHLSKKFNLPKSTLYSRILELQEH